MADLTELRNDPCGTQSAFDAFARITDPNRLRRRIWAVAAAATLVIGAVVALIAVH